MSSVHHPLLPTGSAPRAAKVLPIKTRARHVWALIANVLFGATLSFCYSLLGLVLAPNRSTYANMTVLAIFKATLVGSATLGTGGGILAILISPHLSKGTRGMPFFLAAASSAWFGFPVGIAILHDTMPASIHPMVAFGMTIKVLFGITVFVIVTDLGWTGLNKLWRWLKSEKQCN